MVPGFAIVEGVLGRVSLIVLCRERGGDEAVISASKKELLYIRIHLKVGYVKNWRSLL